ncbi:MAG: multidrug effflux MFS transporter [Arachnia sp.]
MTTHLGDSFSRRRRIALILTLGLLTGLGPFTIDLYLPAFPAVKAGFGLTDGQIQITLSATTLGFALGQLIVGPLSDRFGRRVPLITMTALHVVSSVLVALAPSLWFLSGMRLLQGIGAAGGAVVAMAMARDLFSGSSLLRMMSRLALISGLAPIIAPLIGSWLVGFMPWQGLFWLLAAYGSLIVALTFLVIVETRPPHERTVGGLAPIVAGYRTVLTDRTYVGALLTVTFTFSGLFAYVSSSSELFQEVYGLDPGQFGAVFAVCSFGVFIGVQTSSRISARIGPPRVLMMATTLLVLASGSIVLIATNLDSYLALVPAIFCFTLGFGAVMPSSNVTALAKHRKNSGVAASLIGASNMFAAAITGLVVGAFPITSAIPMGTIMAVSACLAMLSLWVVLRPRTAHVPMD